MQAHRLLPSIERPSIKLIAGPFLPEETYRSLGAEVRGMDGLTLRRTVPDLLAELRSAAASISQCGYNTALDILRARVPALVVPFAEGGEDEQTKRALRLQELGAVRLLKPAALSPSAVAAELRALLEFRPRPLDLDLGGGPASARLLAGLCSAPGGERVLAGGS
jgi:predicted glycosyltransferase